MYEITTRSYLCTYYIINFKLNPMLCTYLVNAWFLICLNSYPTIVVNVNEQIVHLIMLTASYRVSLLTVLLGYMILRYIEAHAFGFYNICCFSNTCKYIVKVSCIPIYHIFIPVYSICQVHDVYVVTVVLSSFSRWLKLNRHVFCVWNKYLKDYKNYILCQDVINIYVHV